MRRYDSGIWELGYDFLTVNLSMYGSNESFILAVIIVVLDIILIGMSLYDIKQQRMLDEAMKEELRLEEAGNNDDGS